MTLYFDVELSRDKRPGTEQKTSLGFTTPPKRPSLLTGMADTLLFLDKDTGPIARGGKKGGQGKESVRIQRKGETESETVLSEFHAMRSLN